ncbi:dTMP kinase [Candidatus Woesearchaeota archaeon]|nr:dTMP kinase [Candidatus Woesearchaeota archaeon]
MNIKRALEWYFTGAITTRPPELLPAYKRIVKTMQEFGRVPSAHVADDDPYHPFVGKKRKSDNVHDFDFAGLRNSVALVAELSGATTGGGAEVDYAIRAGMPVLATWHKAHHASWYITQWANSSCAPPNLQLIPYESEDHLEGIIKTFCSGVQKALPPRNGLYIVVEGGDGCGKSTQSGRLSAYLKEKGYDVAGSREPGGTEQAERIRNVLLSPREKEPLHPLAELFLFEAARAQLFDQVIKPNLREGRMVVTDRSFLSTFAYQGFGRQLGVQTIDPLNQLATDGISPDLAFIIDVDFSQAKIAVGEFGNDRDRIEREGQEFHARVRQGYLAAAERHRNVHVIPYIVNGIDEMQARIRVITDKFLEENVIK